MTSDHQATPNLSLPNTLAKPHINVTPLIDVLLVLLIIFMVVSPLKPARFLAKIPSEPDPYPKEAPPDPNALVANAQSWRIRLPRWRVPSSARPR